MGHSRGATVIPTPRSGAALTLTDIGVPQIPLRVLEVEGLALLAVASYSVVLAVVAHSPTGVPRCHVHSHVKVALAGVAIAIALCDKERKQSKRLVPGEIQVCRKDTPKSTKEDAGLNMVTSSQVTVCSAHTRLQSCFLHKLTFACVTIAAFSRSPG